MTATLSSILLGAAPAEWTPEEAQARWQPMVHPVQHVGVPGYPFQAGVLWDGALVFGPLGFRDLRVMQQETAPLGDHLLHLSVAFGEPPRCIDRQGRASPALRRWLEDGRLPIPHIETRDGDLIWEETVFAHLLAREFDAGLTPRPGDTLVTRVRFQVRNSGAALATGRLWLHLGDTRQVTFGYKCRQGNELSDAIAHRYETPFGWIGEAVRYVLPPPRQGSLRWHDRTEPFTGMTGAALRVLEWEVPLAPGAEAELQLSLPYGCVPLQAAREIQALGWAADFAAIAAAWRTLEQGPGQITTPDPFVNDYLAAVAGQMAQQVACRQYSGGLWMYKTSPNAYEGYWPCNAAKALPVFGLRGLRQLEERVLQSFLGAATSDVGGLNRAGMGRGEELQGEGYARCPGFLGNFGEWTANPLLLSHGLGMWALASHYRITRDRAWLGDGGPGSPLGVQVAAFDWVATQRRRSLREEGGRRVAHWGLLPPASAHDWLAGSTIFNDAWCIYGMTEVVHVLREIGHPRAEAMAAELQDYRGCLRARYTEARDRALPMPLPDGTSLPFVPRMVEELDWRKPDWTITGYGPVRAGAMGALDPFDELVEQGLAYLEAGMPRGEGAYFSAHLAHADLADVNWAHISDPAAPRHWLWRHYVEYETMWPTGGHLFLVRDDLPRFFEWLFNNLAVAIHRDWRVGVESLDGVPSCAPGEGERWQAVRRMFVNERGGYDGSPQSLWLMQAIPRCWLRPCDQLTVTQMGTWFGGSVDLALQVAPDGGSVRLTARLDLVETPREIVLRLRSGDGRALTAATVNGQAAAIRAGDTLVLPSVPHGDYEVVGRF